MSQIASISPQMLQSIPIDLLYRILDNLSAEDLSVFNIAIRTDRKYTHVQGMIIARLYHSKYFNVFDLSYYLDTVGHQKYVARQNRFYY